MTEDRLKRFVIVLWAAGNIIAAVPNSQAGPIEADLWLEFSFADVADPVRGCDPADPAGAFCIPSSGTASDFLDAPPWTFTSTSPGVITVTDAFQSGDRFELFDFGTSLGLTSLPAAAGIVDCGDDPAVCLATAGISSGTFVLAPGNHSLTLAAISSVGGGAGYLNVSADIPTVREPPSTMLSAAALLALLFVARRRLRSPPATPGARQ